MSETLTPGWKTEEHALYGDTARKFLADEVVPNIEAWLKQGVVDRRVWTRAGEEGLLGATIPEAYGGGGVPRSFDAILHYELAHCGDTSWGLAIQSIVAHYIAAYGTEEQKQRWLPGLASGDFIAAVAMTEPGCGSDLQAVATTGKRENGELVLNGSKTFITNGQLANLVCVVTRTEEAEGAKGLSLVFVETEGAEGYRKGQNLEKIGMKGQDTSELFFEGVRVPESNLLGGEGGRGFYQLMNQLVWERLIIGVMALGATDLAVEETVKYTQDRKLFGKRLFDLQNTRMKIAEAMTKAEVLRSFISDCVERLDSGTLDPSTASMAKWWGSEMQCEVTDECLQLFGGYGYMAEYPIARAFADARVQKIYGGANEVMKELIARSLDG
jgi:alkylation response protein AidB-like acyl-CoA dehydrogenase